jgi:hypothetical protein
MPFTVNGIGTSVCGSRGDVGFGSWDALECLVVFFLPVLPIVPMHTFDWEGHRYRMVRLRWSWLLVLRAFVSRWRWAAALPGVVFLAMAVAGSRGPLVGQFLLNAGILLPLAALGTWWLRASDRRTCDIRRVLGPHVCGSCDPALLKDGPFGEMQAPPQLRYGVDSYTEAVPKLLEEGRYSEAMWAARLATALEERKRGEEATDRVLNHPGVRAALDKVRADPGAWKEVMLTAAERAQRLLWTLQQSE